MRLRILCVGLSTRRLSCLFLKVSLSLRLLAADLKAGISVVDFLADKTAIMSSKGEARRALKSNAISLNKEKVSGEEFIVNEAHLIDGKYILAQSGKKNYFLIIVK